MTDRSDLAAAVAALSRARVLCVGDAMLDRFVYGDVERISPEAPIPVIRIRRQSAMLGGAGNVVRNLVALGVRPIFLSVCGDDAEGVELAGLIAEPQAVEATLVPESGRQTTVKTRFVAGSQQLLRADRETVAPISAASGQALLDHAGAALARTDIVVLSDYGKGVLTPGVVAGLIGLARRHGRPVIVDPKGTDYGRYAGATLLTPNKRELAEATGMPTGDDRQVVAAARRLIDAHGLAAVLATRSQDGMTLVEADGAVRHLPAEAREVFDVSGAGDTAVAALAAALGSGMALAGAARLANIAAGIVVGKVGTAVVYANDLIAALHHQDIASGESKVAGLEAAVEQVARWRRHGLSVGFTNGCFDLLHPGHVALLTQARAACDRLIVGLNGDASVARLKGPERPVQSEAARAVVLASLASVDCVVIFGEDTPMRLIETLRPDVLVKGADYTVDTVVGAPLVQSYGGRIVLANLEAGFSTTATIARMTASATAD